MSAQTLPFELNQRSRKEEIQFRLRQDKMVADHFTLTDALRGITFLQVVRICEMKSGEVKRFQVPLKANSF